MATSDIKKGPLYVDSTNNRVGIGTTSPTGNANANSVVLEVNGSGANPPEILAGGQNAEISIAGGSSASYLWSTGAYPLIMATNATERMRITAAGGIEIPNQNAINELTFTGGDFTNVFSSTTNGFQLGTTAASYLSLLTSNTERMRIDSSGGISKNGSFSYSGTSDDFYWNTGTGDRFRFHSGTTASRDLLGFSNPNGVVGSIETNGSSTNYLTSSDYRLKENVTADWDATTRLKQLNPVRFNFIADADTTVDGFLAHEVQSVVPEAIRGTKDEVDEDGNPVMQGMDQSKLVPLLVKTILELEARITALEAN